MQSLLAKASKDLATQKAKHVKRQGEEQDDVVILEAAIADMKTKVIILEEEITKEEAMYTELAKSRVERKLKKGVNEGTLAKNQNIVNNANRILESADDIAEEKISALEHAKETKVAIIEAKIAKLEADKEGIIADIEKRITAIKRDAKEAKADANKTYLHFQRLVDKAYEDVPIDVAYPATHFRKKETLRMLKSDIESQERNILIMKAATYNSPKIDAASEARLKARAMARLEDARLTAQAEEAQRNAEIAEALTRKAVLEQERRAIQERRQIEEANKVTYHIAPGAYNSDYDSEGELLSKEEKTALKKQEEEERVADEAWRKEKGLPPILRD